MTLISKAWRARLQAWAERIDALSLRERVVVFLCLAAILVAVLDSFLISPLNSEAQRRAKTQLKQNQDLQALREQFSLAAETSRGDGQGAPLQQRLAAAATAQAQLQRAVAVGFQGLGAQTDLRELLATLLQQQARLSLVKLTTLERADAPLALPSSAASAPATPAALQWRGVEMQIAGDYLDQIQYLKQLERSLPNLHWGELRLWSQGDKQPVLLQLQVFVPKGRT